MYWQTIRLQILEQFSLTDPYMVWLDLNENAMPNAYVGNRALTTDGPKAFNVTMNTMPFYGEYYYGLPLFKGQFAG